MTAKEREALKLVLELAEQNALDPEDHHIDSEEHAIALEQQAAIKTVTKLIAD